MDYAGGVGAEKAGKGRRILNDALGDGFERFLYDACVSIIAHTAGAIYMCMSSSELHTLQKAFVAAGGHWSTFIIWAKDRFTLGRSDYQWQFEPILYGWPEGAKHHWCGARDQGDVWFIDRPEPQRPAPDDEAGRPRRAGDPQLEPARRAGARAVQRQRHDADRGGAHGAASARLIELDPRYCRRDRRALAGRDRRATLEAGGGRRRCSGERSRSRRRRRSLTPRGRHAEAMRAVASRGVNAVASARQARCAMLSTT